MCIYGLQISDYTLWCFYINEVVVKQKHKCQIASVTVVNRMSLPFIALLGGLISMNLAICTMFPKFT